jgi:hypothetical protein
MAGLRSGAVEAGFRSVHAFPLPHVRVLHALADVASIGLLQERAIRRSEPATEQLQTALKQSHRDRASRGALAQIHGYSTDEASEMLRDGAAATTNASARLPKRHHRSVPIPCDSRTSASDH